MDARRPSKGPAGEHWSDVVMTPVDAFDLINPQAPSLVLQVYNHSDAAC